MKRDWNLIRAILLEIDRRKAPFCWDSLRVDGFSSLETGEHVLLMHEMRLIDSTCAGPDSDEYLIKGLTAAGKSTLRLVGDENKWEEIRTLAKRFDAPLTDDTIILISHYLDSRSRAA